LVGRIEERKILDHALLSSGAELIAMYGRRRIGKTFLIRSVYEKYIRFEFTGVQIDLLLDRRDRCINICEIKFATDEFTISKKYADELIQKKTVFADKTKTKKKTVFLTMITTYGVANNTYYKNLIQGEVRMAELFI
jgi:AAA+ ATPase superfamily predicted ATPase